MASRFRDLGVCAEHIPAGCAQWVHVGIQQVSEAELEYGDFCGFGLYCGWVGWVDGF